MGDAENFFYRHAGYSRGPGETAEAGRRRCATGLATAEAAARDRGWTVHVEPDPEVTDDGVDSAGLVERGEAVNVAVILRDEHGKELGSLYGVVVPSETDPYIRVAAAELASDALHGVGQHVTLGPHEPTMREAVVKRLSRPDLLYVTEVQLQSVCACGWVGYIYVASADDRDVAETSAVEDHNEHVAYL